jgi:hypothetical protein
MKASNTITSYEKNASWTTRGASFGALSSTAAPAKRDGDSSRAIGREIAIYDSLAISSL